MFGPKAVWHLFTGLAYFHVLLFAVLVEAVWIDGVKRTFQIDLLFAHTTIAAIILFVGAHVVHRRFLRVTECKGQEP